MGTKETEVFFNSNGKFMLAEPEMGLVNLETKEVLHEFHINASLHDEMSLYDMQ